MTLLLENCPLNGSRSDILLRCEISRVLLLLILRPTPQRLAPHLNKLLEKYTWGDKSDKSFLGMHYVLNSLCNASTIIIGQRCNVLFLQLAECQKICLY